MLDKVTITVYGRTITLGDYVPTRDGGYIFDGWYLDAACTKKATEGVDLTADITLYAKWIEPLTISGTVTISGTYEQNGKDICSY